MQLLKFRTDSTTTPAESVKSEQSLNVQSGNFTAQELSFRLKKSDVTKDKRQFVTSDEQVLMISR